MKTGDLLFSAAQFLFAAVVVLIGGCLIGLQYAPQARLAFAQIVEHSPSLFFALGYSVVAAGIFLLIGFYCMHRGVYYRVAMGKGEMWVDPALIRSYVNGYWKEVFPEKDLSVEVSVAQGRKVEIFLTFPFLSADSQMAVLEKGEPALIQLLQQHLGYKKEFSLSVLVK